MHKYIFKYMRCVFSILHFKIHNDLNNNNFWKKYFEKKK